MPSRAYFWTCAHRRMRVREKDTFACSQEPLIGAHRDLHVFGRNLNKSLVQLPSFECEHIVASEIIETKQKWRRPRTLRCNKWCNNCQYDVFEQKKRTIVYMDIQRQKIEKRARLHFNKEKIVDRRRYQRYVKQSFLDSDHKMSKWVLKAKLRANVKAD